MLPLNAADMSICAAAARAGICWAAGASPLVGAETAKETLRV